MADNKMDQIFDKLQSVSDRYEEVNELISDPEVISDTKRFMKLSKEEGNYVRPLKHIKISRSDGITQ